MNRERFLDGVVNSTLIEARSISPVFVDRTEGGMQLGTLLAARDLQDPVLFTIPNGGIPVAVPISEQFGLPLHVTFAAKVPFASDTRFGIGAVTPRRTHLNEDLVDNLGLTPELVSDKIIFAQTTVGEKQSDLEGFTPVPDVRGKTVVIVDDGISTGYTALTAILDMQEMDPEHIVVAAPVASENACQALRAHGAEPLVVYTAQSHGFIADNHYVNFPPLTSADAKEMLKTVTNLYEHKP